MNGSQKLVVRLVFLMKRAVIVRISSRLKRFHSRSGTTVEQTKEAKDEPKIPQNDPTEENNFEEN